VNLQQLRVIRDFFFTQYDYDIFKLTFGREKCDWRLKIDYVKFGGSWLITEFAFKIDSKLKLNMCLVWHCV